MIVRDASEASLLKARKRAQALLAATRISTPASTDATLFETTAGLCRCFRPPWPGGGLRIPASGKQPAQGRQAQSPARTEALLLCRGSPQAWTGAETARTALSDRDGDCTAPSADRMPRSGDRVAPMDRTPRGSTSSTPQRFQDGIAHGLVVVSGTTDLGRTSQRLAQGVCVDTNQGTHLQQHCRQTLDIHPCRSRPVGCPSPRSSPNVRQPCRHAGHTPADCVAPAWTYAAYHDNAVHTWATGKPRRQRNDSDPRSPECWTWDDECYSMKHSMAAVENLGIRERPRPGTAWRVSRTTFPEMQSQSLGKTQQVASPRLGRVCVQLCCNSATPVDLAPYIPLTEMWYGANKFLPAPVVQAIP